MCLYVCFVVGKCLGNFKNENGELAEMGRQNSSLVTGCCFAIFTQVMNWIACWEVRLVSCDCYGLKV